MKYVKFIRIFGIVVILSTLIATMPVAVAQTTRFITLWPTKGKIGDTITLVGEGFNKSTPATDRYGAIFFSSQKASTYDDIDNEVKAYKLVKEGVWLDEDGAFGIMISHSAEGYKAAAAAGYSLYLAGHSHGGQVCLPGGVEVVTAATVPRHFLTGSWEYDGMAGYTSRGVGASGVAVRFFCRPEITVITLVRRI